MCYTARQLIKDLSHIYVNESLQSNFIHLEYIQLQTEYLTKTVFNSPEVTQSKAIAAYQHATIDPSPFYPGSAIIKDWVFIQMLVTLGLQMTSCPYHGKEEGGVSPLSGK